MKVVLSKILFFPAIFITILCIPLNINAKTKTKKYKDGSVYVGEWKSGIPQGNGTLTLKDGTTITGCWEKGSFDGYGSFGSEKYRMGSPSYGTITYPDGSVFRGSISSLEPHNGTITYSNGNTFRGTFNSSKPCTGTYYLKDKDFSYSYDGRYNPTHIQFISPQYGEFEGILSDDIFEGKFLSEGQYLNGRFKVFSPKDIRIVSAKGTIVSPTKEIREGTWINDNFTGTSYTPLYTPFPNKGSLAKCQEWSDNTPTSTWYLIPSKSILDDKTYYSYKEENWDRENDYRSFMQLDNNNFKGGELIRPVEGTRQLFLHYKGNYVLDDNNNLLESGQGECRISWCGIISLHLKGIWDKGEPTLCSGENKDRTIKYSLAYDKGHLKFTLASKRGSKVHNFSGGLKDNALKIYELYDKELSFERNRNNIIGTKRSTKKSSNNNHVKCIYCGGSGRRTGINLGLPILGYDSWGHEIVECNYCAGRGYVAE